MKVAIVHILPIEYYPPTINLVTTLAGRGIDVRVWTSPNQRGLDSWSSSRVNVVRHDYSRPAMPAHTRLATYLRWHLAVARELGGWQPDVILSMEPHSAIASWIYFNVFRRSARLFIHHHEYYAPNDFLAEGMRLVRVGARLEKNDLFQRAEWISQTNSDRLALLIRNSGVTHSQTHVLPNYPPREWVQRASMPGSQSGNDSGVTRLIYLGSASRTDTFIEEAARWVAQRPAELRLSVVGNNISEDVWDMLAALRATNITTDKTGWRYDELPERLKDFDAGLILYRGSTQNFVYNVPNKAIEYLAAGLNVWFPPQMRSMHSLMLDRPELPLTEVDFENMPDSVPIADRRVPADAMGTFTAEFALQQLIDQIERGAPDA